MMLHLRHWCPVLLTIALTLVLHQHECSAARILSLSMFASKSHKNVYEPLLKELARRGHEVTSVNPVRSSKPHKSGGVREIVGIPIEEMMSGVSTYNAFEHVERMQGSMYERLRVFTSWVQGTQTRCPQFFALLQIQAVMAEKFDLVLINPVSNECLLGMVHQFGVPYVFVTTLTTPYWVAGHSVGEPTLPSHIPLFFSMAPPNEVWSFRDRLDSFLCHVLLTGFLDFVYFPWVASMYRKQFGVDTPSVQEIMSNSSLVLSNSHYSLNFPRPLMPNHIDVGGMHCRPARPLPKEFDDFVAGSGEAGVIYFSMGSMIQANAMPVYYRDVFLNTFSKLNQSVMWKWENDTVGGVELPPNIKISRWIPQQDVLGHPKTRLFITHGGLLSTEEAVYHGVPLLGFPMYGDQHYNMKRAQDSGFALKLDFPTLTEEILLEAITKVLNQPKFKTQALALSSTFRDRPQTAMDLAAYWVEYVLRHGGAPHLRSPGRLLSIWAYYSVDVIAFVIGAMFVLIFLIYKIIQIVLDCVRGFLRKVSVSKIKKAQ